MADLYVCAAVVGGMLAIGVYAVFFAPDDVEPHDEDETIEEEQHGTTS